mmetsp:Transcript_78209/g.155019  ORF Transcript_78209/g.155019 Transcript_78209/m.155019 type:complete len:479 (-) Transcript_78209:98-1534(-)|eukprot:CAMPEP_0172802328 /NCGR_PEP_ID=MMETSP1075-20121228/3838_1 /TAXON_ID=2916 /ORGANISM="Ceratium fusus, Strain PA161109" /LENGTH=478 /DNA_ID=CAMNT_0013640601 /DNA_START=52 /DNA_END=1488 /DNA_ORIENTATION=+
MNAEGADALVRSISGMLPSLTGPQAGADQAQAASALAEFVSGLANTISAQVQQGGMPLQEPPKEASPAPVWNPNVDFPPPPADAPQMQGPMPTVEEFVGINGLEQWVIDALYLLRDDQREHVMKSPLNLEHTTNLNGVITSRIKEVAPVDQRLQMFVTLNGLADGVVDRLSTLSGDQHEKVMESTLKIQKANNPSGVAMRRITDVLRNERLGIPHGPYQSGSGGGGGYPHGSPHQHSQPLGDMPQGGNQLEAATNILNNLMSTLTGAQPDPNQGMSMSRERSRSRPPATSSTIVPPDVLCFLEDNSLEWWVGEVLARLSLLQRQSVMADLATVRNVRNPSGVVMARVKQVANVTEMLAIFIDLNQIDRAAAEELWALTEEQQAAVMAPGIYIQNVRNTSVAARSRIRHVLAGNDAMGGPPRNGPSEYALTMGSMAMSSLQHQEAAAAAEPPPMLDGPGGFSGGMLGGMPDTMQGGFTG